MVTAKDIMIREVVSTRPSCKEEEVTRVLYHHGISGLPVTDDEKHVIGMVTETDILAAGALAHLIHIRSSGCSPPPFGVAADRPTGTCSRMNCGDTPPEPVLEMPAVAEDRVNYCPSRR